MDLRAAEVTAAPRVAVVRPATAVRPAAEVMAVPPAAVLRVTVARPAAAASDPRPVVASALRPAAASDLRAGSLRLAGQ